MGPLLGMVGAVALRAAAQALARGGSRILIAQAEARLVQMARAKMAAKVLDIARHTVENIEEAEEHSAEYALNIARYLSSGTLSSSQLAAMGHPYARRKPNPPTDPAIIHRQSGEFYRGWRIIGPKQKNGGISTTLTNVAPHAPLLFGGTERMIPRPILQRIDEMTAARRRTNVRNAIVKALLRS